MLSILPGDELLPVPAAIEKAIGVRVHPSTATRWSRHGVKGERIRTVVVGGRPRTTVAEVLAFVARQTANMADSSSASTGTLTDVPPAVSEAELDRELGGDRSKPGDSIL